MLPKQNYIQNDAAVIDTFGGLNRQARIGENEFASETGLCSDRYPFLSVARKIKGLKTPTAQQDIPAEKICAVTILSGGALVDCLARVYKVTEDNTEKYYLAFTTVAGADVGSPLLIGDVSSAGGKLSVFSRAGYLYIFPYALRVNLISGEKVTERLNMEVVFHKDEETGGGGHSTSEGWDTFASGVDGNTGSNQLTIIKTSAGWSNYTHQYGWVAFCDSAEISGDIYTGICSEKHYIQQNKSSYSLPAGGFAVFGNGTSGTAVNNNISVGDKVVIDTLSFEIKVYRTLEGPTVDFVAEASDESGNEIDTGIKSKRTYTAVKAGGGGRGKNELVIFNSGNSTGTNTYGTEALCNANRIVTEVRPYGSGNASIPEGGFVVSGHGTASAWVANNISVGNYIWYDPDGYGNSISVFESAERAVFTAKPASPTNGMRWYDDVTDELYVYSSAISSWVPYTNRYIKLYVNYNSISSSGTVIEPSKTITANGVAVTNPFDSFKAGDAVLISGIDTSFDGTYIIHAVTDGYLILEGSVIKKQVFTLEENSDVLLTRLSPLMDFTMESGNRIWGCRYGVNRDGVTVNEIYASALGDPTNFNKYEGTSQDSYTVSLGCDGEFTGCVNFRGYPVFFKDKSIIIVYGMYPAEYEVREYPFRGVKKGCCNSITTLDEILYYYSSDGFMRLSSIGSVPVKVDLSLGDSIYTSVYSFGDRSIMNCYCSDGTTGERLTFDSRYGVWHKSDDVEVVGFAGIADTVFAVSGGKLSYISNENVGLWQFITGTWFYGDFYKKYIKGISARLRLPFGSTLAIYASYDDGEFALCEIFEGKGEDLLEYSFTPKRCDRFRLRFDGEGKCEIISIMRKVENTR